MNLFRRWIWPRSVRGKGLSLYKEGLACAEKQDVKGAMDAYTLTVDLACVPDDVKGMALYNRALLFAAEGNTVKALADLKAVIELPFPLRDVKLAAKRRLERLQHRLTPVASENRRPA